MSKSRSLLFTVPHLVEDLISLCKNFYKNSPTLTSRILPVFLKYSVDVFILPDSKLSQDANPASSAVIREAVTIPITTLNIVNDVKYTVKDPETLDLTHLIGNTLRFSCKAGFQFASNATTFDPVLFSRGSNIACDAFGIIGLDLSKLSQKEDKVTALAYPILEKFRTPTFSFMEQKFTKEYVIQSFQTAAFKSAVIDQIGEVIKLVSNTESISYASQILEEKKVEFIVGYFNISPTIFEEENSNLLSQMQSVLESTNYSYKGYAVNSILGTYAVSVKALPDLFIIGPIMLSCAKDAIDYFFSLTPLSLTNIKTFISGGTDYILSDGRTTDVGISNTLVTTSISVLGFLYKKQIFDSVVNIAPELAATALVMLSDDAYEAFKESSPKFKVACTVAALTYSYFKDDVVSYFIGETAPGDQDL